MTELFPTGTRYFLLAADNKPRRCGYASWQRQQGTRRVILADATLDGVHVATRFPGTKLGTLPDDGAAAWFETVILVLGDWLQLARYATYGEAMRSHRLLLSAHVGAAVAKNVENARMSAIVMRGYATHAAGLVAPPEVTAMSQQWPDPNAPRPGEAEPNPGRDAPGAPHTPTTPVETPQPADVPGTDPNPTTGEPGPDATP